MAGYVRHDGSLEVINTKNLKHSVEPRQVGSNVLKLREVVSQHYFSLNKNNKYIYKIPQIDL